MAQPGRPESPVERTSTNDLYRGSLIRELRQKKGLSREEMASLLECHPDSVSKVETNTGNLSKQMLSKVAEVLEVPLERLKQAPVHPRILRKKATPSPILRSTLSIELDTILMRRLAVLENSLKAVEKQVQTAEEMLAVAGQNLQDAREEQRENTALVVEIVKMLKKTQ